MTPEQFAELFPGQPFALRYVERGEQGKRKFGWHVQFTSDYWTSDTDSPIYELYRAPSLLTVFGDTPSEAFEGLVWAILKSAEASRARDLESLRESERKLRELEERVYDWQRQAGDGAQRARESSGGELP